MVKKKKNKKKRKKKRGSTVHKGTIFTAVEGRKFI